MSKQTRSNSKDFPSISSHKDIDFSSMLEELSATETTVSIGTSGNGRQDPHNANGRVPPQTASQDSSDAKRLLKTESLKSVVFIDETTDEELRQRLIAASNGRLSGINNPPEFIQTVSYDERAPTLSLSSIDLREGSAKSLKTSSSKFSLEDNAGTPTSILKRSLSNVMPDTTPMEPDLDAEDGHTSDDYRDLYGEDYDRYNRSSDAYSDLSEGYSDNDEHQSEDQRSEYEFKSDLPTLDHKDNSWDFDEMYEQAKSSLDFDEDRNKDDSLSESDEDQAVFSQKPQLPPLNETNDRLATSQSAESSDDEQNGLETTDQGNDEDIDIQDDEDVPVLSHDTHFTINADSGADQDANFETVTLADYNEDMDGLLNVLEKIIRRNKASKLAYVNSKKDDPTSQNRAQAELDITRKVESFIQQTNDASKTDGDASNETRRQDKVNLIMAKLSEANVKKITTRIYIEDARSFKTSVLTSLMSAQHVVNDVVESFRLEASPDWALFELCNDIGIERPLRDWEIVTDVLSAWDRKNSINAIVMKKYSFRLTLSPQSLSGRYPRIQGYLYLELKPGKWQKRFCFLKDSVLFYYRESNNPRSETPFCNVAYFDVYTLSRTKKMPTEFGFAVRSISSASSFIDKSEYCKFICVEKKGRLKDWVLALRLARNEHTFLDLPEIFEDYLDLIPEKARRRRSAIKEGKLSPTLMQNHMPGLPHEPSTRRLSKEWNRPHSIDMKVLHTQDEAQQTSAPAIGSHRRHGSEPEKGSSRHKFDTNPNPNALFASPPIEMSTQTSIFKDRARGEQISRGSSRERQDHQYGSRSIEKSNPEDAQNSEHLTSEAYRLEKERRRHERHEKERALRRQQASSEQPLMYLKQNGSVPDGSSRSDKHRERRHHESSSSRHRGEEGSRSTSRRADETSERHPKGSSSKSSDAVRTSSKSSKSSRKMKPLVDLSDVNNCRQCGCSEYRRLTTKKDALCANCSHVHNPN